MIARELDLTDDQREQYIRKLNDRYRDAQCQCATCFLIRRLDEARAILNDTERAKLDRVKTEHHKTHPASAGRVSRARGVCPRHGGATVFGEDCRECDLELEGDLP